MEEEESNESEGSSSQLSEDTEDEEDPYSDFDLMETIHERVTNIFCMLR